MLQIITKVMTKENKFVKVLIKCGVTFEQLRDYEWDVIELEPNKFHCIGCHPVARRIDIIKDKIVVH
jgi:hypothetical protein